MAVWIGVWVVMGIPPSAIGILAYGRVLGSVGMPLLGKKRAKLLGVGELRACRGECGIIGAGNSE